MSARIRALFVVVVVSVVVICSKLYQTILVFFHLFQ
jgi:hypothetical protein